MEYLATRICTNPSIFRGRKHLSFDSEIWQSSNDFTTIFDYFYDEYGCELKEEDTEYYQPKDKTSLNLLASNLIPCVIGVEEKDYEIWLNSTGFEPANEYQNTNLLLLGYEVLDLGFINIQTHGISPLENSKDFENLNDFCLFNSKDYAKLFFDKNTQEIPEHTWKITGLYVSELVLNQLKKRTF